MIIMISVFVVDSDLILLVVGATVDFLEEATAIIVLRYISYRTV